MADRLGIRHYVINLRDEFYRYVIQNFIEEYRMGRTPNPCSLCNKHIKFSAFLKKARGMGADLIATGHYARIEKEKERFVLKKGLDRSKDQSYFLYSMPREALEATLFPVGGYEKETVRKEFRDVRNGFIPESQDICFIPDGNYRSFIEQWVPSRKGPIVTIDGKEIGLHQGVHNFTVGQRRGLNAPYSEPLYVVDIRPAENLVIAGPRQSLVRTRLTADNISFFDDIVEGVSYNGQARIRYRQKETACSFSIRKGELEVIFVEPVNSVTPGQSVVLYDGERVVGGGTIQNKR